MQETAAAPAKPLILWDRLPALPQIGPGDSDPGVSRTGTRGLVRFTEGLVRFTEGLVRFTEGLVRFTEGRRQPKAASGGAWRALRLVFLRRSTETGEGPTLTSSLEAPPAQHLALMERSVEVGEAGASTRGLYAQVG